MTKIYLQKTRFEGKIYYYFTFSGKVFYISTEFVKFDEIEYPYIQLPLVGCEIITLKNVHIIRRGFKNLFLFSNEGLTSVKVEDGEIIGKAHYYDDCIETQLLIITATDSIKIFWNTDRGIPGRGISIFYSNGEIETLPYIEEEEYPLLFQET